MIHKWISPGGKSPSAEQTVSRLRPLLPEFGITRIANLTGLDRTGIPVVMVCRPNSRSSAVFHGKGVDLAAAQASGIMEAIETWHAEHVNLPLRFGSHRELEKALNLVDIDHLPGIPGRELAKDFSMLWVEGHDLISDSSIWVPLEIVHASSAIDGPPWSGCLSASTNGLASGNFLWEAISHGLCEVVERDATSLWHQMDAPAQNARRIDLSSIHGCPARDMINRIAASGLDVAIWDTTTDVGIPAAQCMIIDSTGEIGHSGVGAGCHPNGTVAALKAVIEAAQVRTTYIIGSREDIEPFDYLASTLESRRRRCVELMRPQGKMRDFRDLGRQNFSEPQVQVGWLIERLKQAGMEQIVAVNLTRPEYGIPVVRVIVPGLEGSDHHEGYTPGRRAKALLERSP